ncbi:FecR protein [Planctomycetes bacterium CA13]|uniref:FecR protein n=1 Tax=Novipirellula herctigrandis TaxID=2527986 RepID=A0A5C5Z1R4_9BACT|nr:FecR protein [Planctomycetes bacterium CA13]
MNDEQFLRLTTLYLEEAIDACDLDLLNRDLANSPDRVRQFNDLRLLAGLINEHGYAVESEGATDLETNSPAESANFNSPAGSSGANAESHFPSRRATAIALAVLATAATLLLVLNWPDTTRQRDETATAIATLAYTSHARWGSEERALGDGFGKGKLHLEVGLARLDFCNGATVTLQGPAEFEILSTDRTILSSGILTASIPESAVGFEVVTPAMDVVDLGTAFGVSVGADGETDVCVFEGEVEVSHSVSEDVPQLVREGNAVRSKPEADSIDSVDYSTERYEDAWPVTSGVLQATGLTKFVSPGPDFVPGRYEDSERILVFLERSQVLLKSDLKVNVTELGQYIRVRRQDKQPIAAGQVVRSYLLQFNPIGEFGRKEADGARVIGQITFDRPILGLIGGTKLLNASDEQLGHPLGDYGDTLRGIEPTRPDDLPDSGRDNVTLSRDRRTLSLDLSASSAVDQIRVIVSEQ